MKIGRNDPCPCGSGITFKKCCPGKHLTVEAHVLLPEFADLFTDEEKKIARSCSKSVIYGQSAKGIAVVEGPR